MQVVRTAAGSTFGGSRIATHGVVLRPRSQMTPVEKQGTFTLQSIPSTYKGVLLDQFGVLHDGTTPYPGAVEAVEYLHDQGAKLLIISNSSRRAPEALKNLAKMGFNPTHFAGVITSGEVSHQQLQLRPTAFWQELGCRCLHFTWAARGAISLDGLGLEVTQDPAAADFILAHGTEALGAPTLASSSSSNGGQPLSSNAAGGGASSSSSSGEAAGAAQVATPCSLGEMQTLMQQCADRGRSRGRSVPMVVANPDVVTVHGTELRTMPGTLARMYREMGGEVHLMGKPAPIIYQEAVAMLGLPREQVVAIGDSLEHDIAGAQGAGVDSLLIVGGIHAAELQLDGTSYSRPSLEELCGRYAATPAHVLPWFRL